MGELLEFIVERGLQCAKNFPRDQFRIRGLSNTEYFLQLSESEVRFHLYYVLAQTTGQGCCHYEPRDDQPGLSRSLLGQNALDYLGDKKVSRPVQIALLDAVFSTFRAKTDESYVLRGTNIDKAAQRTALICDLSLSLLADRPLKTRGTPRILNAGVVGSVVSNLLKQGGIEILASDFDSGIVGRRDTIHGVRVESGWDTPALMKHADLAIVTGMALANNTLTDILASAKANNTALVVFAETGSNFASIYCEFGVDIVLSEAFPFYLVGPGESTVDVYRRFPKRVEVH